MKSHLVQVLVYELRRNLRRRGYLLTTFGVPLLAFVLVLGYQFISNRTATNQPQQNLAQQFNFENVKHAGYVDLSGLFPNPGELSTLLTRYPDEASAQQALDAGQIAQYYVIAKDYMQTGDVTLVQPRLNVVQIVDDPIRRLILNTLSKGVEPQVFQRLVQPSNRVETNLALVSADQGPQDEGSSFLIIYAFAIILMISLFTTNGYLMQSVIEEKETRLIEILISTVRPLDLLAGKIIAMGLLGLFQIAVWVGGIYLLIQLVAGAALGPAIGALTVIANIHLPLGVLPLLLLYFVLAYFMFAGFYSIVGAVSNSMREGPQFAVFFSFPAIIPIYLISLFSTTPDGPIPTILSLFPLTAPLAMVQRLVISTVPAWQVVVSLVLIAALALLVMWLAGRIFRVQVLLAGQMPRLRDLPRLLRG